MREIKVDDEVFAILDKEAEASVITPNSVLRRKLGLDTNNKPAKTGGDGGGTIEHPPNRRRVQPRAPKANLHELREAGLLRNGERLYLVDYQGRRVEQCEAVISGRLLEFKGQHYTMSKLAEELLKKVGFRSNAVRGPTHWMTAKNVSVAKLWEAHNSGKRRR